MASSEPQRASNRRLPIGAEVTPDGVSFRVWAPKRKRVTIVFENDGKPTGELPLQRDADGYHAGVAPQAKAGDQYKFRLDDEGTLYPDPISRYQPQGPHGPSQIVDHASFKWNDANWKGRPADEMVLYELHVGTFTPAGTWAGATEKLEYLRDVGITCIEMMPIADLAGDHNWGYDGVDMFAPVRNYGSTDDLRRFIDAAHALGICVILDVVYNHLGPEGNYVTQFSDTFFSDKHGTDWGSAINFDDAGSAGVREFYIANAHYWIEEFHFDGFRFDATQNIYDDSSPHILQEITTAARAAGGERFIYLINENEPQHTKLVRSREQDGYGMNALWNDDFHHSAIVNLTGHNEAFYSDYLGAPQEFISAVKYGYLFQGQRYRWSDQRRGTPGFDLPPTAFVNYIQNHDQIANFGMGYRLHRMSDFARIRAMTMLLLLSPQAPMLFQGQEFLASTPFNYFVGFDERLNGLVKQGRVKELSQFPSISDPQLVDRLPDPGARQTFENCKLNWSEIERGVHAECLTLHRELLKLRREDPVLRRAQKQRSVDGAVIGVDTFVIRFFGENDDDRLLVMNFGVDLNLATVPEPLLAPPIGTRWKPLMSTEEPRFGGHGTFPLEGEGERWRLQGEIWRVPGRCGTIMRPE